MSSGATTGYFLRALNLLKPITRDEPSQRCLKIFIAFRFYWRFNTHFQIFFLRALGKRPHSCIESIRHRVPLDQPNRTTTQSYNTDLLRPTSCMLAIYTHKYFEHQKRYLERVTIYLTDDLLVKVYNHTVVLI